MRRSDQTTLCLIHETIIAIFVNRCRLWLDFVFQTGDDSFVKIFHVFFIIDKYL